MNSLIVECFKCPLFLICGELQVTVKMADLHQSKVIFSGLVALVTGETQYTAMVPPEVRAVEWEQRGLVSSSLTIVINEVSWGKLGRSDMAGFVWSLYWFVQKVSLLILTLQIPPITERWSGWLYVASYHWIRTAWRERRSLLLFLLCLVLLILLLMWSYDYQVCDYVHTIVTSC